MTVRVSVSLLRVLLARLLVRSLVYVFAVCLPARLLFLLGKVERLHRGKRLATDRERRMHESLRADAWGLSTNESPQQRDFC